MKSLIVKCSESPEGRFLKPGYTFKINKMEGGAIPPHFFPRNYLGMGPDYCVVEGESAPSGGIRTYDVFIFHGPFLEESHNPHWVHKGKVPSNSGIIESVPDEEFSLIRERLEHWTHKSQAFDGSGYRELLPKERLNLTNGMIILPNEI